MLSHPLQYSPQSLTPQFPGVQAGFAQMSPAAFGQPGVYNGLGAHNGGNAQFGYGQFGHEPFAPSPYFAGPLAGQAGIAIPAHQIIPVLGQLVQQIAVQSAVAQQVGIAVQQLVQQLAVQATQGQGLQGFPVGGFNPQAQPWGSNPQAWGNLQVWGNPQTWGGANPQSWGANRSQTIQ